ncbi:MAG TPA: energy transducer TonB [Opitutaceae bacterium]|nr:energy transducer TonB [Opitutaceae bacterium]
MTILMSRSPGIPEYGGGRLQAHRLAGDEFEIRRQLLLLAVGIAVTFALFLALPFMQVVSSPIPPDRIIIDSPALPVPAKFEPPPPPITPEKPVDEKPVLTPEKPFIPYERLFAPVNPNGPRVPMHTITLDPGEMLSEIFNPDQLDRQPSPIHTVSPDVPRGTSHGGNVLLEFIVTPQGSVASIKVISSTDSAFERAAVTALAKWKFEPGVKNNTTVSTRMRLPMRFKVAN